jgi:hypothetical protein
MPMSNVLKLHDERIDAWNYLIEISIGEYLAIARNITSQNEYQRRRIKASHTIYSVLKDDILKGCVIPPIVLAFTGTTEIHDDKIKELLIAHKDKLVILDGLQRTYTFIDLERELGEQLDEQKLKKLNAKKIRLEVYVGINRLAVLYRMLTLNTGQTPMSLRQQVEMLYLDYSKTAINGINLIREVDEAAPTKLGDYSFKDIVEGFNSYLERNELPIDRFDLLERIKSLEKLSLENQKADLFANYLKAYHSFVQEIVRLSGAVTFTEESLEIEGLPFGKDPLHIFTKPQAASGFGAALGKLKDFNLMTSFDDVVTATSKLKLGGEAAIVLGELLKKLEQIRNTSKKIGNAQRMFFHYFFRELYNPEGDSYLNVASATGNAFQKYLSQTS